LKAYKKITDIIKNKNLLQKTPIRKLTIISPKDPLIKLLKMAIRTGPKKEKIRFQNNVINIILIEDALIYLLQ